MTRLSRITKSALLAGALCLAALPALAQSMSGGGAPGGATGQVQYNNGGTLAGSNLLLQATNILEERNGTAAQTLRVYNTFTDASNYERGVFDWGTVANALLIGTQNLGTGAARPIEFVVGGVNKLDYGVSTGATWTSAANFLVSGAFLSTTGIATPAADIIGWSSTASANGSKDTGLTRDSAGVVDVGNGAAGDKSGTVKATAYFAGSAGATAGVTCSGSPTASFASTNGIVTHC